MTFTPEFILQILVALSLAGATYAAIRADLARLHAKMERAEHDIQTLFTLKTKESK